MAKAKEKELIITVENGNITSCEGLDESFKIKIKDYDIFTVTIYDHMFKKKKELKLIEE